MTIQAKKSDIENRRFNQPLVFVVADGLIMGLALGIRHATGIFQVPITMGNGWTREVFGRSIAVQNQIWGVAQPFTGMLADRFGSMRVIVTGLIFYAVGLALMSIATTPMAFTLLTSS